MPVVKHRIHDEGGGCQDLCAGRHAVKRLNEGDELTCRLTHGGGGETRRVGPSHKCGGGGGAKTFESRKNARVVKNYAQYCRLP